MDLHDFYTGRTFDAHRFFGAHFELSLIHI